MKLRDRLDASKWHGKNVAMVRACLLCLGVQTLHRHQKIRFTGPRETERHMASKTTNPFIFLQQVRQEAAKVTWPSRRETLISTAMVFGFAAIAMMFFFAADQLMAFVIELILGFGS